MNENTYKATVSNGEVSGQVKELTPTEPPLMGGVPLDFAAATERIKQVVNKTPLVYNHHLSKKTPV